MRAAPALRWPDGAFSPALRAATEEAHRRLAEEWWAEWTELAACGEPEAEEALWLEAEAVVEGDGVVEIVFDGGTCSAHARLAHGGATWRLRAAALLAELDAAGAGDRGDLEKRILAMTDDHDLRPWLTEDEAVAWSDLLRAVVRSAARDGTAPVDIAAADEDMQRIADRARRRMLGLEPPLRPGAPRAGP